MHLSEKTLISFKFVRECFICRSHVFHLFIDQKLDRVHVLLISIGHLVEIVVEQLESLREGIYFAGDLVSQVSDTRDVLENFLLLVLEVL